MQKRAGLLFLSKNTKRLMLILENQRWTVPTFSLEKVLLDDAADLLTKYHEGRILPIELYLSQDRGFEYGTYVCLVDEEFLSSEAESIAWCSLSNLPKGLHTGLNATLNNAIIKTKIETILELENATI